MFYLIFKSINPDTSIGVPNLKYDIVKLTIAKFKNNVKDILDYMYSNYTIIIYKGELHDNYVCHLFGYLFSGPNSAFDSFIDLEKDYWYT